MGSVLARLCHHPSDVQPAQQPPVAEVETKEKKTDKVLSLPIDDVVISSKSDPVMEALSPQSVEMQHSKSLTFQRTAVVKKISEDDFTFHNLIGVGGFGRVFLAKWKADPSALYAIKVIGKVVFKDNGIESLLTELKVMSLISDHGCPFLTKLYCSFQSNTHIFFCLEFVRGGSLRGYLNRSKKFPVFMAKFIAAEVILGLTYLHEKLDIIHRDLKPENILVDEQGHIKLTDFGLSKVGKVSTNSFCGTLNYLAPELIRHETYGKGIDFWMLGCLIYEMVVGIPPFAHKNRKTLFDSILTGCYKLSAIQDTSCRDLVSKLLVLDQKQRLGFQSVQEVTSHSFFRSIDFKQLAKKSLDSPLKPLVELIPVDVAASPIHTEEVGSPQQDIENFTWIKRHRIESEFDLATLGL